MALIFSAVFFTSLLLAPQRAAADTSAVDVWWPTDGAHIQGVQPFKGLLENTPSDQYTMYWQVDTGGLVPMNDDSDVYPHKEAQVDLSGWNWKGAGPYVLTFTAKDKQGNVIGTAVRTIYIGTQVATSSTPIPTISSSISMNTNSDPLSGKKLYVDPNTSAEQAIGQIQDTDPTSATLLKKISAEPQAIWLGNWLSDAYTTKTIEDAISGADEQGTVATFVLYNIPQRDCGGFSAGGTDTPDGYEAWISTVANAIGNGQAITILEPDALADITCLSQADQNTRLSLISSAVTTLKNDKNNSVYIDAGHPNWISSDDMSALLNKANIANADGFSLNVSNYESTADNISYGDEISQKTNGSHFVIDTSRNGNGSDGEWCNASGRALGNTPTTSTGNSLVDAFLWIKHPGESDGNCNGGPSAGTWWTDYALDLARNSN